MRFPRNRAFRDVDDGQNRIAFPLGITKRFEGVDGFARLGQNDGRAVLGQRRFAVAELGCDIDLYGDPRQLFQPTPAGKGVKRPQDGRP